MRSYDTVVEAINDLIKRGFSLDLNISFDQLLSKDSYLDPEDFEVIETYRFEGNSDPEDEDIVLAMASKTSPMKGVFTGAFGIYANTESFAEIKTIKENKNPDG